MGPWIVTRGDLGEARDLRLELRVNGVVKQSSTTAAMLFDIPTTIADVSSGRTLHPGDLIFTGTPGQTSAIKPGDVVEVELEGVGVLRNPVAAGK